MSDPRTPNKSSSSTNLISSLLGKPTANALNTNESKGELIYIPQKCYGIITPESPKAITGLYTTGLHTCSGVVAIAQNENYRSIYFCHADTYTDLLDKTNGLLGWLNQLPKQSMKISISYDDAQHEHYQKMIKELITIYTPLFQDKVISQTPIDPNHTELITLRNGKIERGGYIHFDYDDNGYTLHDDIAVYEKLSLLIAHHNTPHPPIKILDSSGVLTLGKTYEANPWLSKAIQNAEATEMKLNSDDITEEKDKENEINSSADNNNEPSNLELKNRLGS